MNICKRVVGLEGDKVCTSGASDLFRTHTYVSTFFILLVPVPVYQLVWIPQRRARRVVGETPRRVIQLGLKGFRAGGTLRLFSSSLCACCSQYRLIVVYLWTEHIHYVSLVRI